MRNIVKRIISVAIVMVMVFSINVSGRISL